MDGEEERPKLPCGCEGPIIMGLHVHCPKCNAPPKDQEVRDYNMMWGDGKIYCRKCGTYVRDFDRD